MAKKIDMPIVEAEPFASLEPETRKHIEALEGELIRARGDLDAMDELGVDTTGLRERVDWAEKARKIILERFG